MCGIWAVLGNPLPSNAAKYWTNRIKARGPEGTRIVEGKRFQLGFTRLAINGLNEAGMQPMRYEDTWSWVCNGELYNWFDLKQRHKLTTTSGSDCEILGPLMSTLGADTDARTVFRSLDGVFATIMINEKENIAIVARDPYGVRPLFVGYQADLSGNVQRILFSSELKGMATNELVHMEAFPPGHYAAYDLTTLQRIGFEPYHTVPWLKNPSLREEMKAEKAIKVALEDAVLKRMMTERPVAALLSGGLDSSLIAALVQKSLRIAGAPDLQTFSIGFEGSEDLKYARLVADHIGSKHTEVVVTPEQFWEAIPQVINDIESYDITTVRASVGNWMVSKYIAANSDCKVVFNGDGSDEVLGGYKYFYNAPNDDTFEAEITRLLTDIHYFDVLRSDRCISSHGLEARTPFLDKQFVAVARSIATDLRRPSKEDSRIEKNVLRQAFSNDDLLPADVLWRKKEAFSDGVSGKSKSWYEICQEKAAAAVPENWQPLAADYTHLTPKTAEAYYYRRLFSAYYPGCDKVTVPYHWMPRWCPGATDPSARTLEVYKEV